MIQKDSGQQHHGVVPDKLGRDGLVDVGGYRLAYRDRGTGGPTVVLEPGVASPGLSMSGWDRVQDGAARFARVVAYDRAGLGASDPAPITPRTPYLAAADLHALLAATSIPGPYVLVGHSWGGVIVRVYAQHYPDDVAGVVLVDTVHAEQDHGIRACLPAPVAGESDALTMVRAELDAALVEGKIAVNRIEQMEMEVSRVPEAALSLGDRPLVVLTAGVSWLPTVLPALTRDAPEVAAAIWTGWQEQQRDLARLSTRGTHIIVEGSGHNIQVNRPDAIIDAIHRVTQAVREDGRK